MRLNCLNFTAIINLANVAVLRERYDEAREYAKKSLQINPKCSITLKLIKWLNKENEEDVSELNVVCLKAFFILSQQ